MEKYRKRYKTNLRLNTIKSCNQQLGRIVNSYLNGDIDEVTARTVGYVINILIRGIERSDIEERIEALERSIKKKVI